MLADLIAHNAPRHIIEGYMARREAEKYYEILEENLPVLRLFLRLQTQWRTGGMGGFLGLDYNVLPIVAGALGLELTEEMLDGLQTMEYAALAELNRRDGDG